MEKENNNNSGDEIRQAAALLAGAKNCVALTGAGISTESGIPDFRSPGTGLWETTNMMAELSATAFWQRPARFFEVMRALLKHMEKAEPNSAHLALAEFERAGIVKAVITQNIDGLHVKAGSRQVYEVHGHVRTGTCTGCGASYPMADVMARFAAGQAPPECDRCRGAIKPDVVLFEDPMPPEFMMAYQLLDDCDLLLIVGSSLVVTPVSYLPMKVEDLVIVNLQPTSFDSRARVVIHRKAGEALTGIREALKQLGRL